MDKLFFVPYFIHYSDIIIIKTFYMTTGLMKIYNAIKHNLFHILIIFLKVNFLICNFYLYGNYIYMEINKTMNFLIRFF